MAELVAQMTKQELQELIEASVERKLTEMFGDPDAGLELKKSVREYLLRRRKAFEAREDYTTIAGDLVQELGLD